MLIKTLVTASTIVWFFFPTCSFATEATSPEEHNENILVSETSMGVTTLKQVTVVGQATDELTGSSSLNRTILGILPAKNSSINEALGILPGIQFSEKDRTSLTAGEILPPEITISGGKTYQNNFMIDGISNNNIMDPATNDPTSSAFVPAQPESLFLSSRLVEQVTLYRYNIPASIGSFTGGAVDIKTRQPEPSFFGELTYRTTNDSWTKFHIDRNISEAFSNSNSATFQPKFTRHDGGLLLNIPINKKLKALASYQQNYSKIPLTHLLASRTQERKNENYLLKLAYDLSHETTFSANLNYSPYEGNYFYRDSLNSDFTIKGGGISAGLSVDSSNELGDLSIQASWSETSNERKAPTDIRPWLAQLKDETVSSKPWGLLVGSTIGETPASFEGSVGSMELRQESSRIDVDFTSNEVALGPTLHRVSIGSDYEKTTGELVREEPTSTYFIAKQSDFDCALGITYCAENEQYFYKRRYFAEGNSTASINLLDVYLEDEIEWNRVKLRAGLRVSYDDFMENTNIAPRLAASFDLFGNGRTILLGGANRYYGRTLLAYKLREGSQPSQLQQLKLNKETGKYEWQNSYTIIPPIPKLPEGAIIDNRARPYVYSKLETPYSDELILGIEQEVLGGKLIATWVQRKNSDEFSTEVAEVEAVLYDSKKDNYHDYLDDIYRLTNNGSSEHDEYTLEWERTWNKHYLNANVSYQETSSSNESYTKEFFDEDLLETIWYEGSYMTREELPRQDFNRPWVANLIYSTKLPYNITFTNATRYQSGYEGLTSLSDEEIAAKNIVAEKAYKKEKKPESWVFDWRLDWSIYMQAKRELILTLEANNIFNENIETGAQTENLGYQTFGLGRQFWLSMTYKF